MDEAQLSDAAVTTKSPAEHAVPTTYRATKASFQATGGSPSLDPTADLAEQSELPTVTLAEGAVAGGRLTFTNPSWNEDRSASTRSTEDAHGPDSHPDSQSVAQHNGQVSNSGAL